MVKSNKYILLFQLRSWRSCEKAKNSISGAMLHGRVQKKRLGKGETRPTRRQKPPSHDILFRTRDRWHSSPIHYRQQLDSVPFTLF